MIHGPIGGTSLTVVCVYIATATEVVMSELICACCRLANSSTLLRRLSSSTTDFLTDSDTTPTTARKSPGIGYTYSTHVHFTSATCVMRSMLSVHLCK